MRLVMFAAAVSIGLAATATSGQSRGEALRELLAHVPLSMIAGPYGADLDFSDLTVAARAMARPPEAASEAFRGPYRALYRARPSLFYDVMQPAQIARWPELAGFAWYDVESALSLVNHPQSLRLVGLRDKAVAGVWPALLAAGYTEGIIAESPALIRGEEDFAINIAGRIPDDPFGGDLGQSSRIILQGAVLVQTPDRGGIESVLSGGPYLTDDPEIVALLNALEEPALADYTLLRAIFLLPRSQLTYGAGAGVPVWTTGLVADLVAEDMHMTAIILAFDTPEIADQAAGAVGAGWRDLPLRDSGQSLAQMRGNDLITWVTGPFSGPDDGPYAMIAIMTEPRETRDGMLSNETLNAIYEAYVRRDLAFLAP